jgi:hypothetical protein
MTTKKASQKAKKPSITIKDLDLTTAKGKAAGLDPKGGLKIENKGLLTVSGKLF